LDDLLFGGFELSSLFDGFSFELSDFVFLLGNEFSVVLLGLFLISGELSLGLRKGDLNVVEHVHKFSQ